MWDLISVGENKTPFIRAWKPLPSRRVLKTLRESWKGKAQRGQYLIVADLGCYKWYQSQTQGNVPTRRMSFEGGWTRGGVPSRTLDPERGWIGGLTSIEEEYECQRGRWALKGGGLWDPTSVGAKNKAPFIRVWKPLPSRHVLKTLRKSPKGKTQRGQYLEVVDLGCYMLYAVVVHVQLC